MPDLPFETAELRKALVGFLATQFQGRNIGSYRWGVYLFYDYDLEPIYVGQTMEGVSTRIRRHLTNQRTDAVAMSVLDPFEVYEIEVWPLPQFQSLRKKDEQSKEARKQLDALEHAAFDLALNRSKFAAILNEKWPAKPPTPVVLPTSFRARIVADSVSTLRRHADVRIARRAATLARLAQVIAERQVNPGLRRTLLTQAKRLASLGEARLAEFNLSRDSIRTEEPDEDSNE